MRSALFRSAVAAGCVVLFVLGSCGGDDPSVSTDRQEMLAQIGADVVLPSYRELDTAAADLAAAAMELRALPSESALAETQSAWRRTRAAWRRTKAFELGPAERLRTFAKIDWTPIRPDRIEQVISGTDELTQEHVAELGANVKGFLAVEYLLFDPDGGDAAVLETLTDGGTRRLDYLVALALDIEAQAAELLSEWEPEQGGYATVLAVQDGGNAVYPKVKTAVDDVVNHLITVSRDVERKLGAALGVAGEPDAEVLEARRSLNEVDDLLDDLRGIENVYRGSVAPADGRGIAGVVGAVAPRIDRSIVLSLELAMDAVDGLPRPLAADLEGGHDALMTAQLRALRLAHALEIDLVSALGATLAFNPGDGD
jgi:predicted lipoprotein